MDANIIRIKKSTAKRAYIMLLLPTVVSAVSLKNSLAIIALGAIFTAISYAIFFLIEKYLSPVIAYPTCITVLGMFIVISKSIPDIYGFHISLTSIPAVFFALFLLKYITGKNKNKLVTTIKKFAQISIAILAVGIICEILSVGSIFDIKIHSHPVRYFRTRSGVFLICAALTVFANLIVPKNIKLNINRSFRFKKGSVKLVLYSSVTALVVSVVCKLAYKLLDPLGLSYLYTVLICFFCGALFICYRLIDKKFHIGRTAVNLVPSLAFLLSYTMYDPYGDIKNLFYRFAVYTAIFVFGAYTCEILADRSSKDNAMCGAPTILMLLSVSSLLIPYIKTLI